MDSEIIVSIILIKLSLWRKEGEAYSYIELLYENRILLAQEDHLSAPPKRLVYFLPRSSIIFIIFPWRKKEDVI